MKTTIKSSYIFITVNLKYEKRIHKVNCSTQLYTKLKGYILCLKKKQET